MKRQPFYAASSKNAHLQISWHRPDPCIPEKFAGPVYFGLVNTDDRVAIHAGKAINLGISLDLALPNTFALPNISGLPDTSALSKIQAFRKMIASPPSLQWLQVLLKGPMYTLSATAVFATMPPPSLKKNYKYILRVLYHYCAWKRRDLRTHILKKMRGSKTAPRLCL
jgi:hypothetical protein